MGCPACTAPMVNHTAGLNPDCAAYCDRCPVIDVLHCAAQMAQDCDTANQVTNRLGS